MRDEKRLLRQLKRDIKRTGNRKRRRFLKNVNAPADEFDFGENRSDVMNERRPERIRRWEREDAAQDDNGQDNDSEDNNSGQDKRGEQTLAPSRNT